MITRVAILGICAAIACIKRPSAEECDRAWDHVSEVLRERAFEEVKKMAPDFPDEARKGLAEQTKQFQGAAFESLRPKRDGAPSSRRRPARFRPA